MHRMGFTLIELLVVIAIIGILSGIFGWNLLRSIRSAELREATTNFASDLRRARSQAQRGSADMVIQWTPNGAGNMTTYSVAGQSRTLANSVKMTCSSCGTKLTYTAPYGEIDATGNVFVLTSPMSAVSPMQVRVVGVTGKVIIADSGS